MGSRTLTDILVRTDPTVTVSFIWKHLPYQLWRPPSLQFREYWWLFMWRWIGRRVVLTTCLHLLSKLRVSGAILLLPLHALITRKGTISPVHRTPSALLSHSC